MEVIFQVFPMNMKAQYYLLMLHGDNMQNTNRGHRLKKNRKEDVISVRLQFNETCACVR